MSWKKALKYVACLNTAKYLGHDDWRLPNINELESLINCEQSNPGQWLGTQGFTNVRPYRYWSSTTHAFFNDSAWFVFMWDGAVYYIGKPAYDFAYIWPVRAGQTGAFDNAAVWKTGQTKSYYRGDDGGIHAGAAWPNPRFIDHGDGTVTDNLTGLMWTKDANPAGEKTWQQALDYVASMNAASGGSGTYDHNDWRLPNMKELRSLADYSKNNIGLPAGNPFTNVQQDDYWSSTTSAGFPSGARVVNMTDGYEIGSNKSYDPNHYVWPVRAGRVANLVNSQSSARYAGSSARAVGLSVRPATSSGIGEKALADTGAIGRFWKWLKSKVVHLHSGTGGACRYRQG